MPNQHPTDIPATTNFSTRIIRLLYFIAFTGIALAYLYRYWQLQAAGIVQVGLFFVKKNKQSPDVAVSEQLRLSLAITDSNAEPRHLAMMGYAVQQVLTEAYHGPRLQRMIDGAFWRFSQDGDWDRAKVSKATLAYVMASALPRLPLQLVVLNIRQATQHIDKFKQTLRHESMHYQWFKTYDSQVWGKLCLQCEADYTNDANLCQNLHYTASGEIQTKDNQSLLRPNGEIMGVFDQPLVSSTPYYPVTANERERYTDLMWAGIARAIDMYTQFQGSMQIPQELHTIERLTRNFNTIKKNTLSQHELNAHAKLKDQRATLQALQDGKLILYTAINPNNKNNFFYSANKTFPSFFSRVVGIEYHSDGSAEVSYEFSQNPLTAFLTDIILSGYGIPNAYGDNPDTLTLETHAKLIEHMSGEQYQYLFPELLAYEKMRLQKAEQYEGVAKRCFG